jgi:hypothetical protein
MSTANALNFKLRDELGVTESVGVANSPGAISAAVAIHAGRMAAACEKLDHLEDFPFRPVLRSGVIALVDVAAAFATAHGWDLRGLVQERLERAKARFIHRHPTAR